MKPEFLIIAAAFLVLIGFLSLLLKKKKPSRIQGVPRFLTKDIPGADVRIEKHQEIHIQDPDTGEERVYHSLDDVPPEYREKLEQCRSSIGEGDISRNSRQTFILKGLDGKRHEYESLEEMPPEIRRFFRGLDDGNQ